MLQVQLFEYYFINEIIIIYINIKCGIKEGTSDLNHLRMYGSLFKWKYIVTKLFQNGKRTLSD